MPPEEKNPETPQKVYALPGGWTFRGRFELMPPNKFRCVGVLSRGGGIALRLRIRDADYGLAVHDKSGLLSPLVQMFTALTGHKAGETTK